MLEHDASVDPCEALCTVVWPSCELLALSLSAIREKAAA